tara:strand:+ start:547 stop:705 length:159 start_codon:yes stop_codon:yes gene_type:complete
MKKFKVWFLTKMIFLCNQALNYSDGADDQEEINGVIKTKNYFIKELESITSK